MNTFRDLLDALVLAQLKSDPADLIPLDQLAAQIGLTLDEFRDSMRRFGTVREPFIHAAANRWLAQRTEAAS